MNHVLFSQLRDVFKHYIFDYCFFPLVLVLPHKNHIIQRLILLLLGSVTIISIIFMPFPFSMNFRRAIQVCPQHDSMFPLLLLSPSLPDIV